MCSQLLVLVLLEEDIVSVVKPSGGLCQVGFCPISPVHCLAKRMCTCAAKTHGNNVFLMLGTISYACMTVINLVCESWIARMTYIIALMSHKQHSATGLAFR